MSCIFTTLRIENRLIDISLLVLLAELQLKPHHVPFAIRSAWQALLRKYTLLSDMDIADDEPLLMFRRNLTLTDAAESQVRVLLRLIRHWFAIRYVQSLLNLIICLRYREGNIIGL